MAGLQRRPRRALYHAALAVTCDGATYVIEMAPVWNEPAPDRGVVATGAVGLRWLGVSRLFRYEVRCWRGGRIPDLAEAVDSPRRVSDDADVAAAVVRLAPTVPTPVWGRWNSNSVIAWLLTEAGVDAAAIEPPPGGRAPGWALGLH